MVQVPSTTVVWTIKDRFLLYVCSDALAHPGATRYPQHGVGVALPGRAPDTRFGYFFYPLALAGCSFSPARPHRALSSQMPLTAPGTATTAVAVFSGPGLDQWWGIWAVGGYAAAAVLSACWPGPRGRLAVLAAKAAGLTGLAGDTRPWLIAVTYAILLLAFRAAARGGPLRRPSLASAASLTAFATASPLLAFPLALSITAPRSPPWLSSPWPCSGLLCEGFGSHRASVRDSPNHQPERMRVSRLPSGCPPWR